MAMATVTTVRRTTTIAGFISVPTPVRSSIKERGLDTIVPGVAFMNIGEQFNPYLAIEGRLGTGFVGDQFRFYHVDVPLVYGGYVKGMLPLTPWFSGYAIAGVGGG